MAKITIGQNDGITTGFLNLLKEKQKNGELDSSVNLKFNREQWNKILSTFADLNDARKANNQKLIFSGGSDYSKNNWHNNFVVRRGSIELSDAEENALIAAAFGAQFSGASTASATKTNNNDQQTQTVVEQKENTKKEDAQTAVVEQKENTKKEDAQTVVEQPVAVTDNNDKVEVSKPKVTSSGDQAIANNLVTELKVDEKKDDNDATISTEAEKEAEKQEEPVITKDPFNKENFEERMNKATISADIVKAQTDALIIGTELRDQATQVDLAEMKKYSGVDKNGDTTQEWQNFVRNYVENDFIQNNSIDGNSVNGTNINGDRYDNNKSPIKDRILNDENKDGYTLAEEVERTPFAQYLAKETKVGEEPGLNLNNVEGVNVLNLENLTLENTNEQIGKVGESLAAAANKIDESVTILAGKRKASMDNVKHQNENIATQVTTANSALNIIKSYVKVSKDDQEFLTEYTENKAKIDNMKKPVTDEEGNEIGKEEYTSYQPFGRYQFAREAQDKQIITNNFDNLRFGKTNEGYVWDYIYIPEEEKESVEGAMTRLMNKYPNIKDQMQSLAKASEQITKSRQGVIDGLKDVARYEILQSQLGEIKQKLTDKSSELLSISQNLQEIDEFYEAADKKADKMYESEKNSKTKATGRADYKVGRTDEKGNQSREVLGEDDDNTKFDAGKDNRRTEKANKEAKRGKRESDKATGRVVTQQEKEAIVNKHDRAVYDRDDALRMYKPLSAKTISDEAEVPESLKEQYKVAVNQFSNFSLELYGNTIRVKDKESGELKYTIYENTSTSEIRQIQL